MFIRKLGKTPTKSHRLEAFKRWDWVQSQIDAFHTHAAAYWIKDVALQEEFDDNAPEAFEDANSDSDVHISITTTLRTGPDDPEKMPICLPSNFGSNALRDRTMRAFVKQEINLQEGQANNALWGPCLSLSRKLVLYRTSLRHQKTKKGKTCSRQEIHEVDANAKHFAKVYT